MKTLSMFLRASKTEAEEAGLETEGMAESVSKLRKEILSLTQVNGKPGVDIMLDDNTYKSTYQILKELSLVWEDLSDVTQANILERIAGKRNANIAASVITNFSVAEEALATSTNSAGSALEENEKYLDSIAGHANKVTIAFEDLSQNFIESDFVKTGADVLTTILTGLNEILQVLKAFPTAMSIIAAAASSFGNMGIITRVNADLNSTGNIIERMLNSMRVFGKSFKEIANDTRAYGNIFSGVFGHSVTNSDKNVLNIYRDSISDAISNNKTTENGVVSFDIDGFDQELKNTEVLLGRLSTAGKDSADKIKDLGIQFGNGKISERQFKDETAKLANAQKASTASTVGLTIATTLLNTALTLGISLAIQAAITGLSELINGYDNAIDRIKESTKSIEESENNLKSYNDELRTTRSRIAELQSLDTLNLFEQDELNNLKKINAELEEKRRLEQLSIEQAKAAARENALKAWLSMGGYVSTGNGLNDYVTNNMGRNYMSISNWFGGTTLDQIQGYIDEYQNLTKHLEDYTQEEINTVGTRAHWIYKQQQEIQTKILEVYKNQGSNISQIILGLDPEKDKEAIELLNSFLNIMREINGEGAPTTFTEVWESADYVKTTAKLAELAKQGKLTTETFENVEGIEDFKTALEAIGKTNIYDIIQAIIDKVTESGDEAETASEKITTYAKSLEKIKDAADDLSKLESLTQEAYEKISNGGSLTDEEVEKFREYPKLFKEFTKDTDGWTISVDALSDAYSELGTKVRDAINEAKADTIEKIALKREEVGRIQETLRAGTSSSEAKQYRSTQSRVRELDKEIKDGISNLEAYDNLLELYSTDFNDIVESANKASKVIANFNSRVSTGATAYKEMQKNGRISLPTYESIISLGDEYKKTLTVENGVIKFNIDAYKELTNAKLVDAKVTARLAFEEVQLKTAQEAQSGGITSATQKAYKEALDRYREAMALSDETIEFDWTQALKDDSELDKKYQKRLNKLKDANKNTIEDERQFINSWTALNEEIYKAVDTDKYEDNLREIREYIKGLDGLLDKYLEKWDRVNNYDENDIASRMTRLSESRNVNYSTYGDPTSLFYNLDTYEKNAADQAKYEADTLKLQFDRGLTSYTNFISGVKRIRETARDRDGNYLLDMSFVSGYEDIDKLYDDQLDKLQKFNDKSLDDEAEYVRQWKALNDEIYKGTDITKYESNLKEIANYERDLLDRRFKEGLISAEDYRAGLISLWEDNNAILGEGVLNEWLSGAVDNEKAELDRLYNEGKISAKEYFDYVKALWEENQDILGQRTQEEWLEDAWKKRAETEKTYWEQQKDLATDYYDAELKKLQDVKDEEEKISKAEELRLNLIKARKALEDAKSQRNQLVFHNGTFEYMADQEAVMSAQEEIAEALKAIKDNELEEQIKLLEEQKDEALLFYDNIIGMLDYYLNDTKQILTSDSEVINHAEASESGQYFRRLMNGEITMDEVKEELKKKYTKDPDAEKKVEEKRNTWSEQAKAILGMGPAALMQLNLELWDKAGFGANVGALGSATAQDIASSAVDNVYNNSSINNDNSVKVGDIHMTIQGGTSVEMLNEFASKLGSAISTLAPRAIAAI